jgi:hypothetical protein
MDKEQALEELFKSLKISLKSASLYSEEHPAFVKSVGEAKEKIDILLNHLSPLRIDVTPNSLWVDGKSWEKGQLYGELAGLLHNRRIKTIEFKPGITIEEMVTFLMKLFLPAEDIIKGGGLDEVLKEENVSHVSVEELDYASLLGGDEKEIKDIWPYLLQEAVEKEDLQKVRQLADSFKKYIGGIVTKELFEDKELRGNIEKFFTFLKGKDRDKFSECTKYLYKSILKNKDTLEGVNFDELRRVFKDLEADDIASVLWDEMASDRKFDAVSFHVFSQITEKDKDEEIATSLAEMFRREFSEKSTPQVREKMEELLSDSARPYISDTYRQIFLSLLKDISIRGDITLDQNLLNRNYRFMLLNLVEKENKGERLLPLLEKIEAEWQKIIDEEDLEYLKGLLTVLDGKGNELSSEPVFMKLNEHISYFIDNAILQGGATSKYDDIIPYMKESAVGSNAYIEKIFKDKNTDSLILRFFFKLFPDDLPTFEVKLKESFDDLEFIKKITESLGSVDSPLSLESLKYIFSLGGDWLKLRVLKSMQQISVHDENFLLPLLKKNDFHQRKEAAAILIRDENTKDKVIEELLSVHAPLGKKNKVLRQNIIIMDEVDLREAKDRLLELSRKRSLWNKKARKAASKVLENWNER